MELLLVLSDVEYCGKNRLIRHISPLGECILMDIGNIPVNLNFRSGEQMETYNRNLHHIHGDLYMFGDEYIIEVKGLEEVGYLPKHWCEKK